jgi:hypothetical protein
MGLGMSSLVTWSWPRYFIVCVPYLTEKYYELGMLAIQPDKSASKNVICQVNIENINKQVEELTEKKLEENLYQFPSYFNFLTCTKYPLL